MIDEGALLLQIGQGDRLAFQNLYEQAAPQLFAIAVRLLKKQDIAEEVLQDVFLTLWHVSDQYNVERGSVRTWLSTITRNRCIDRMRRQPVMHVELLDEEVFTPDEEDPMNRAMQADDETLLSVCMHELNEQQRLCVSLAFFDGMTHQEVANHLTVPLGSAKTWIRRGIDYLKKCMERTQ